MASANKPKSADKQAVSKKIVALLKKHYKGGPAEHEQPVLETLMYALCLEDATEEQAQAAYARLHEDFFDLNEIRVSAISELARAFAGHPDAEARALRVRSLLQHVFEKNYDFEFEGIRRKTLEQAVRQLNQVNDLTPFARDYALQSVLGSHLVAVDRSMWRACVWLGLAEPDTTPEQTTESLKSVVRKAEGPGFCHLLRRLAMDAKVSAAFDPAAYPPPEDGYDLMTAPNRLKQLLEEGPQAARSESAAAKGKKPRKSAAAGSAGAAGSGAKSAKSSKSTKKSAQSKDDGRKSTRKKSGSRSGS
jgi:endonuclease-3